MGLILVVLLGWPAIIMFLALATIGAWLPNQKMMIMALCFSLGPSLYIFWGNGWIQLLGVYIPLCLGISTLLIKHQKFLIPKLLLVPMYIFYTWFGYAVATQWKSSLTRQSISHTPCAGLAAQAHACGVMVQSRPSIRSMVDTLRILVGELVKNGKQNVR